MKVRETIKVKGSITLLFNRKGLEIDVLDEGSRITFLSVCLNPEQVMKVFSRQACVECDLETRGLNKVGLKMEHKEFEFLLDNNNLFKEKEMKKEAIEKVALVCPKGWEPDYYFNSQDSFFVRNGKLYAKCIIRRWVKNEKD